MHSLHFIHPRTIKLNKLITLCGLLLNLLLNVFDPLEHGNGVEVEEHNGKHVLAEEDKVSLYKLRILEHVGSNLCLGSPPPFALRPLHRHPLHHVSGNTEV